MKSSDIVALISFAPLALAQIPPASFGFPSVPQQLLLSFQNGRVQTTPGVHYAANIPVNHEQGLMVPIDPSESEPASSASISSPSVQVLGSQQYLIVMIDPDASTPQSPSNAQLLHWLEGNYHLLNASTVSAFSTAPFPYILYTNETTTPAFVPYAQPSPPSYSDAHRYIQYLFRQPPNFKIPAPFQGFSASNRSHFNITNFVVAAGLAPPVAANWFYCSNMSSVPANFSAAPSSNFPGVTGGADMSSGVAAATGVRVTPTRSPSSLMPVYTGYAEKFGSGAGPALVAAAGAAVLAL